MKKIIFAIFCIYFLLHIKNSYSWNDYGAAEDFIPSLWETSGIIPVYYIIIISCVNYITLLIIA